MRTSKRTARALFAIALLAMAMLCMAGCSTAQQAPSASSSTSSSSQAADGAGKTLVAYYSATGNTATVAQVIVAMTSADSFTIEPVEPYTSQDLDYNDANSRVSREHADASLRDVTLQQVTPEDWDSYDTIFIGYPIWWGMAAWPVDSFVKANDFEGKTVIPFCTSASSDIGTSADDLAKLANGGEWLGGMRFPSNVNDDEILQWLADLGQQNDKLMDIVGAGA